MTSVNTVDDGTFEGRFTMDLQPPTDHIPPGADTPASEYLSDLRIKYRKVWKMRQGVLDQDADGGFSAAYAFTTMMGMEPMHHRVSVANARVLAGNSRVGSLEEVAKTCVKLRLFSGYVRIRTIEEAVAWIIQRGPIVVGVNWLDEMLFPSPKGLLSVGGRVRGRHAVVLNGYWPAHPDFGTCFVITGSWGSGWGIQGRVYLPVSAFETLSRGGWEAIAPVGIPPKGFAAQIEEEDGEN